MTIDEALIAADPIRYETSPGPECRDAIRRMAVRVAATEGRRESGVSRRLFVLAGATAALLAALTVSPVWMRSGTPLYAAMQFEVRLAGTAPGAGTREAIDVGSGRTIFIEQDVILTNEDIAVTRVVSLPDGFGVEVDFTDAGARKVRSVTAEHVGYLLAIVVDGDVLAAPAIRSPIDHIGLISGTFTREEAERLAEGIRNR